MTGRPIDPGAPVVPVPRSSVEDDGGLAVAVRHRATDTVARVTGELDIATAPRFLAALDELCSRCLRRGATPWTLWCDLSGVDFVSASGVTVLEAAARAAGERGVTLKLVSCSRPVRRVLSLVGSSLAMHADGIADGAPAPVSAALCRDEAAR